MTFRTEYSAKPAGFTLNPTRPVMLLGSCFADNITQRMQLCRWDAHNPFGVLFNPLSIAKVLNLAMSCDIDAGSSDNLVPDSIFENEGIYHSWLFDSKKSSKSHDETRERIFGSLRVFRETLPQCEALFITFGTAWCYFLNNKKDYVVANCHKQPQTMFTRRRICIEEITAEWKSLIVRIHERYPELRIIFTVSPVRHLKDGFIDNTRSKATLILAVEQLCSAFDCCSYFPAYEIVNDDLRDYRFYASDLAHPSDMAIEYIWEKFLSTYISAEGNRQLRQGEKQTRRERHRDIIS